MGEVVALVVRPVALVPGVSVAAVAVASSVVGVLGAVAVDVVVGGCGLRSGPLCPLHLLSEKNVLSWGIIFTLFLPGGS